MYQINIGIKLRVDLLRETADDANPTITCIVKTYMLKKRRDNSLRIRNSFQREFNKLNDGIMIAFKDDIEAISIRIQHEKSISHGCR